MIKKALLTVLALFAFSSVALAETPTKTDKHDQICQADAADQQSLNDSGAAATMHALFKIEAKLPLAADGTETVAAQAPLGNPIFKADVGAAECSGGGAEVRRPPTESVRLSSMWQGAQRTVNHARSKRTGASTGSRSDANACGAYTRSCNDLK